MTGTLLDTPINLSTTGTCHLKI